MKYRDSKVARGRGGLKCARVCVCVCLYAGARDVRVYVRRYVMKGQADLRHSASYCALCVVNGNGLTTYTSTSIRENNTIIMIITITETRIYVYVRIYTYINIFILPRVYIMLP